MRVCKMFSVNLVAIILTVVCPISSRSASDPPFQNEESAQSSTVPPLVSVTDPKPAAVTASISGRTKPKAKGEPTYPQSANVIPGKAPRPEYNWKTRLPFEISHVDGFTGVFTAGKPIELSVEGHSPAIEVKVVPDEGFRLTARIFDEARTMSFGTAHGEYDAKKQAWQVSMEAPDDVTQSYEMEIFLYCAIDESRCAEIYGRAAQTSKALSFQLQSE